MAAQCARCLFRRSRRFLVDVWAAWRLWDRHGCVDLSAAFAYHTLQSIFPILLITLSVASWTLGRDDGILTDQIMAWTAQVFPESAVSVIRETLSKLYRQRGGAGFLGVAVLLVTSSNVYLSLQRGTDHLWSFQPASKSGSAKDNRTVLLQRQFGDAVRMFIIQRFRASLFVLIVGALFVLDQMTINLRLMGVQTWRDLTGLPLAQAISPLFPVSSLADLILSLVLSSLGALALMRVLPSKRVRLRHLLSGAVMIGLACMLLNLAVGRSLISLGLRFQAYGLIGGILVLTLWIWLLGLIFYFGVAFSVVQAHREQCGDPHLWLWDRDPPQERR